MGTNYDDFNASNYILYIVVVIDIYRPKVNDFTTLLPSANFFFFLSPRAEISRLGLRKQE